ncbi:MAG: tRNA pseudouridine(55) synthase TruB [Candidatus Kaelpia aquatica]|nr:tRNA pseudouridine(55) synthase TruB [Candidatus Kaelpia aquatica]
MFNGFLLVDKPAGITSHDVVDFIRRRFNIRRVGHGGTLDPLATGLLILMLGRATKLSQHIIGLDKDYFAQMSLGFSTTTGDLDGKIVKKAEDESYLNLKETDIQRAVDSFIGEIDQIPPMYSAVKYKGKRLYKLARRGIEVQRKSRKVKVYDMTIEKIELPEISLNVKCSRGLYIRQLCVDLGEKLGYPAHLSRMVRTSVGKFSLDQAKSLDQILNESDSEKYIIAIETVRRLI